MSIIDREHADKRNLVIIGVSFIVLVFLITVIMITQRYSSLIEQIVRLSALIELNKAVSDSTITVSNQAAATSVTIDSASLTKPGYIVIHELKNGIVGPAIGHSPRYNTGALKKTSVVLNRPSVSGETLYAMLHDDDGNGSYEFPGDDTPTLDSTGEVVVAPFIIH